LCFCFQIVNFISDIGGQLGLWAGFSVLSLLEIIELCILLFSRRQKQKQQVDNVQGNKTDVPERKDNEKPEVYDLTT